MTAYSGMELDRIFPACRRALGDESFTRQVAACGEKLTPAIFVHKLREVAAPAYLPDLARLELSFFQLASRAPALDVVDRLTVNPSLELLELNWKNLVPLIDRQENTPAPSPEPGEEMALCYQHPQTGRPRLRTASAEDLLLLKMVVEGLDRKQVAAAGDLPISAIDDAIDRAVRNGLLLAPPSRIRRDCAVWQVGEEFDENLLSARIFTLQWHLTQACDLHCKHCYDRSARSRLPLPAAMKILDDLDTFCRQRHVRGQVSLSGGNPLLYPHFFDIYRAASERGFAIAVLGNPAPREQISAMLAIQPLAFYQVSLEGLPEHNDAIRGTGHFDRVMEFLGVLRELGVYSMVMLTLTNDNLDQVLPLAEMLRDKTDLFTFNRLAMVGEGAQLRSASINEYAAFLKRYMDAAETNPVMRLKDNLFNLLRLQEGLAPIGGCAGFGCGAAFNFVAVLPDGEVHACRKFPSYLGNIHEKDLGGIYDCEAAQQYRAGPASCRSCTIRPVCGGCLAVTHGYGRDVFTETDPYCFAKA